MFSHEGLFHDWHSQELWPAQRQAIVALQFLLDQSVYDVFSYTFGAVMAYSETDLPSLERVVLTNCSATYKRRQRDYAKKV